MKKLLFIALIAFGYWNWQSKQTPVNLAAFDSAGKPQVILYTFAGCGEPCAKVIAELEKRQVPYTEAVVDPNNQNEPNFKAWEKTGENQFPLTVAGEEMALGDSTSALLKVLAVNFQDQYLTSNEAKYYNRHFDSNGNPQLILYGTSWCPYCASLRKDLNAEGIAFIDFDVEKSVDYKDIVDTMEIGGYPTVWYGYERLNSYKIEAIKKLI
jgi:glutaredoxin